MKGKKSLRFIALASSLTFVMAGSVAAGYIIGQFLENRMGGNGLLTALFIFLGILAGFYNIYREVKKAREN